jgi:streptomycin 3"-adenylyltransferase
VGREAPSSVRAQIDRLLRGLHDVLSGNLRGVYLHGSLALGCFNPARSDVDILVVVAVPLERDEKLRLVDLLLVVSNTPHKIELDVLTTEQLDQWRHPSPYEFHYGESHRVRYACDPVRHLDELSSSNPDLAAHVTVARAAGISVFGPEPHELLHDVPFEDYLDSLLQDLEWSRTADSETYGILSPCRIWATLTTGEIHSKVTGTEWALARLPDDLTPPVEAALAAYRDDRPIGVNQSTRRRLFDYIADKVRECRESPFPKTSTSSSRSQTPP